MGNANLNIAAQLAQLLQTTPLTVGSVSATVAVSGAGGASLEKWFDSGNFISGGSFKASTVGFQMFQASASHVYVLLHASAVIQLQGPTGVSAFPTDPVYYQYNVDHYLGRNVGLHPPVQTTGYTAVPGENLLDDIVFNGPYVVPPNGSFNLYFNKNVGAGNRVVYNWIAFKLGITDDVPYIPTAQSRS